ncbi:hypothetical protein QOZ99_000192 [Angulomicrobium amanitiforme]|uniref:DUF6867 domain-containing protein n=1 Tax=Ancylobacter amanitiformis TaxID=217069 RepID=A0ABU0LKT8_9HYPH|nr:hypothetical protein [Ancylobacter amanitiformis]
MAHSSGSLISQGAPSSLAVVVPALVIVAVIASAVVAPWFVVEVSRGDFTLVTLFLGGGAAWLTGRSVAGTWRSYRQALIYALLLGCVVRFFHFALFLGTLLSWHYFLTDTAFLIAVATLGFRSERARQMATRYGWIYRQSGPFGWVEGGPAESPGTRA